MDTDLTRYLDIQVKDQMRLHNSDTKFYSFGASFNEEICRNQVC